MPVMLTGHERKQVQFGGWSATALMRGLCFTSLCQPLQAWKEPMLHGGFESCGPLLPSCQNAGCVILGSTSNPLLASYHMRIISYPDGHAHWPILIRVNVGIRQNTHMHLGVVQGAATCPNYAGFGLNSYILRTQTPSPFQRFLSCRPE